MIIPSRQANPRSKPRPAIDSSRYRCYSLARWF